jgi:hypothetical protein
VTVFRPAQELDCQAGELRRHQQAKLNGERIHNKELNRQIASVQEQIQELQTQLKVLLLII